MKIIIIFISLLLFLTACSSDDIVQQESDELFGIFRNIAKGMQSRPKETAKAKEIKKTNLWLSKFNQPIILVSSLDKTNEATLVALGNNEEKLTWVSADGISVSYDNGILIATRGYSQDLLSLKYKNPANLFSASEIKYDKVHRYLSGQNNYHDIYFKCTGIKKFSKPTQILEYNLSVDTFVEKCEHSTYNYVNTYDLLAGTTIVLRSTQWISPANKSFLTYNYYAFQKF